MSHFYASSPMAVVVFIAILAVLFGYPIYLAIRSIIKGE